MISFQEPKITDALWLQPILWAAKYPGAEYTFNNMFFWDSYYGGVAQVDGFAVQAAERHGTLMCCFPAGVGDPMPVVEQLVAEARRRGLQLRLRGVTDPVKAALEAAFPGKLIFTAYRDAFDYIYTVEELTQLRGKKLQAKRNHCNRFAADYPDWYTQPVTRENMYLCRELSQSWYEFHEETDAVSREKVALNRAFDHFETLGMDGLILFDGVRPVGFSMGVRMHEQYYDVNFEKAYAGIQGAYAMINREFSKYVSEKYPELVYLNREDDMGEPGLRRAKESYQPTQLLEKFNADWQEGL